MKEVAKVRATVGLTATRRAAAMADRCKNMVSLWPTMGEVWMVLAEVVVEGFVRMG